MCDETHMKAWAQGRLTRRRFGAGAALMGGLAACAPLAEPGESSLVEQTVTFPIGSHMMDGMFIHPASGSAPAILFWPDIAGIRPANMAMARRLAGEGYAVLLANPYYRDAAGQQWSDFADFWGNDGFARVRPWRERFTPEAVRGDAFAAIEWLDAQDAVASDRGMGSQGYCMTGPFALWAATASDRVRAAASFHGGGLVQRDTRSSPHNLIDDTSADYLIAIARDDDAENPQQKEIMRGAIRRAGENSIVEVYGGDHGWTVPDSQAYDRNEAERAWAALLALNAGAL